MGTASGNNPLVVIQEISDGGPGRVEVAVVSKPRRIQAPLGDPGNQLAQLSTKRFGLHHRRAEKLWPRRPRPGAPLFGEQVSNITIDIGPGAKPRWGECLVLSIRADQPKRERRHTHRHGPPRGHPQRLGQTIAQRRGLPSGGSE